MSLELFEVNIATRPSICRICYKDINKKELIVRANLGSGKFHYCYHWKCFFKRYKNTLAEVCELYLQTMNPSKRDN